jgi:hypothetical protein
MTYSHIALAITAAPLTAWSLYLRIFPTPGGTTRWKRWALYATATAASLAAIAR